jgi:hypothetical protein
MLAFIRGAVNNATRPSTKAAHPVKRSMLFP